MTLIHRPLGRRTVLKLAAILGLGSFAVVLAASGCVGSLKESPREKTFGLRLPAEPETLDWNRARTQAEGYVLMNLMEGLVRIDENLKAAPALAERWTVSPDGKVYTFMLRPGLKWSDGVPLKAEHFIWKRLLLPETAASYAYFLYDIEGAEAFNQGKEKDFSRVGVKALDDRSLRVTLARPIAYWAYLPSFWVTFPLRSDIVEKYGAHWARPGKMVTVGPFTLAKHDIESRIVMKANPNYYGPRGNVEQVNALVVRDDSSAIHLFETGKLDFLTDLPALEQKRLAGRPELRDFPYLKTAFMTFVSPKSGPVATNDVHVRRAIQMAIDRAKVLEALPSGYRAAKSFVPPGISGHAETVGLPYDPVRARAELAKAKVPIKGLQLALLTPNTEQQLLMVQVIQSELKKNLGIDVTLDAFDLRTYRGHMDRMQHPLMFRSWGADYPDGDNFLSMFLSNSGNNLTGFPGFKDARYDSGVLEARAATDPAKRQQLYVEAQKLLQEDAAVVMPVYYGVNKAAVSQRVQGLVLSPLNYLFLKGVVLK